MHYATKVCNMAYGHKMSIKYPLCTILLLLVAMHQCKVDMTSKVQEGDLGQKPCRYILSTTQWGKILPEGKFLQ